MYTQDIASSQHEQQEQEALQQQQQQRQPERSLFVSPANAIEFVSSAETTFGANARNVAINKAGSVVVFGTYTISGDHLESVYVYALQPDGSWQPKGAPIDGVSMSTRKSSEVHLTDDGNTLAIQAIAAGSTDATILIYTYDVDTDEWSQQGSPIPAGGQSPMSRGVALADNTLVIGKASIDSADVYQRDVTTGAWTLSEALTDDTSTGFGQYVTISSDASTIAVGMPNAAGLKGRVIIFKLDDSTGLYTKMQRMEGTKVLQTMSIPALTDDAKLLAIASWNMQQPNSGANSGSYSVEYKSTVQVYQLDETTGLYSPFGLPIEEELTTFALYQLSISRNNRVLTTSLDEARLYELHDDQHWLPVFETGSGANHAVVSAVLNDGGYRIVTSADGRITAWTDATTLNAGRDGDNGPDVTAVRYYDQSCTEPVPVGYRFLSQMDSAYMDYALLHRPSASIQDLAARCDQDQGGDSPDSVVCKGFTSKGALKMDIRDLDDLVIDDSYNGDICQGLYIKLDCVPQPISPSQCGDILVPCGYEFVPGKEMPLNIYNVLEETGDLFDYAAQCDSDPKCAGFDSNGNTKRRIVQSLLVPSFFHRDDACWGTFVKV